MAAGILRLPTELLLRIATEAGVSASCALEATSRDLLAVLRLHEDYVWRIHAIELTRELGDPGSTSNAKSSTWRINEVDSLDQLVKMRETHDLSTWSIVRSWRQYAQVHIATERNWLTGEPRVKTTLLPTDPPGPPSPINCHLWRFRPDFEERYVISTSITLPGHHLAGAITIVDLDTGVLLSSVETHFPYQHLEYDARGKAFVVSTGGDGLQVWRRTQPGGTDATGAFQTPAPHRFGLSPNSGLVTEVGPKCPSDRQICFQRTDILPHDKRVRGFHLRWPILCVVSDEGIGWIWNLEEKACLLKTLKIAENAVGHLEQDDEVVMYAMNHGYDVHVKDTGALLGTLDGKKLAQEGAKMYSLRHTATARDSFDPSPSAREFVQNHPWCIADQHTSLKLEHGNLYPSEDFGSHEWRAGMIRGSTIVGISMGQELLICSDWEAYFSGGKRAKECVALIQCTRPSGEDDPDPDRWLTAAHGRAAWSSMGSTYILPLPKRGRLLSAGPDSRSVHCFPNTMPHSRNTMMMSCMHLTSDGLLSKFMTHWMWRGRRGAADEEEHPSLFDRTGIRSISFGRAVETRDSSHNSDRSASTEGASEGMDRSAFEGWHDSKQYTSPTLRGDNSV
ncbi:hypothetical protein IE81DRAFT_324132 [Ceraceosorus guamensis]|uniref:Uncharacterized protein n=1 Tax=Ceraceosorus guamensis TaxID=1522189 RepID=A0A316W288_9BASI|nr:hypothetical protein IE81DRAFT_324132 [Ceraceosorus guamensis]PWN41795.1 hypothetical protein IE81DRAFT_324132 [Ceraceosorus guamensis]